MPFRRGIWEAMALEQPSKPRRVDLSDPHSQVLVPAGEGHAVRLAAGERLRVTTPSGGQVADFFAFTGDLAEWLSAMHTWVSTRSVRPREGDTFVTQLRQPLIAFAEDGAGGVHEMLLAACDPVRYEQYGFEGHHRSCAQNLREALAALGLEPPIVPQPVNLFSWTVVEPDQRLASPANPVPPGSYVVLEALRDAICVVSSCPFDLPIAGWEINAASGPTELVLEALPLS